MKRMKLAYGVRLSVMDQCAFVAYCPEDIDSWRLAGTGDVPVNPNEVEKWIRSGAKVLTGHERVPGFGEFGITRPATSEDIQAISRSWLKF